MEQVVVQSAGDTDSEEDIGAEGYFRALQTSMAQFLQQSIQAAARTQMANTIITAQKELDKIQIPNDNNIGILQGTIQKYFALWQLQLLQKQEPTEQQEETGCCSCLAWFCCCYWM